MARNSSVEHNEKHGVYKKRKHSGNQQKTNKPQSQSKINPVQSSGCKWCGGNWHLKKEWPAREETCRAASIGSHKCRKKGHFTQVCGGKTRLGFRYETLQWVKRGSKLYILTKIWVEIRHFPHVSSNIGVETRGGTHYILGNG